MKVMMRMTRWLSSAGLCLLMLACSKSDEGTAHQDEKFFSSGRGIERYSGPWDQFDLNFNVVTPPSSNNRSNSVIYFFHGSGGDENSDLYGFTNFVDKLIQGEADLPVIVFVDGGKRGLWGSKLEHFAKDIVPFIDESYRGGDAKGPTIIFGFSMGGAAAFRIPFLYPDVFDLSVSLAGGIWRGDDELSAAFDEHLDSGDIHHTIAVINGDDDRPGAFSDVKSLLTSKGISFHKYVLTNQDHNLGLYYQNAEEIIRKHMLHVLRK